jgi:hypothetical protein
MLGNATTQHMQWIVMYFAPQVQGAMQFGDLDAPLVSRAALQLAHIMPCSDDCTEHATLAVGDVVRAIAAPHTFEARSSCPVSASHCSLCVLVTVVDP